MKQSILLLRGINVGGHGKLPMAELTQILESLGASNVKTYIQSGNAVFQGALTPDQISDAILAAKGFQPKTLLMTSQQFTTIANQNPWPDVDGKSLHISFAVGPFDFNHGAAETLRKPNELIHVTERAIYLHAPDGIGRSKLAAKIERLAGVDCTARNLNTVTKLMGMIG